MAKKIIGLSASPKKNGNNEKIIDYALKLLEEKGHNTKKILLSEEKVSFCKACNYCKENGKCVLNDSSNKINEELKTADAIILSSPVYFGSMSAQLKALLDRTRPLRKEFLLKGKPLAAFAVGASRNGGQELTIKDIHAWGLIHGMIILGDNNHFGGTLKVPFEEDDFGKETIVGTVNAIDEFLNRLK